MSSHNNNMGDTGESSTSSPHQHSSSTTRSAISSGSNFGSGSGGFSSFAAYSQPPNASQQQQQYHHYQYSTNTSSASNTTSSTTGGPGTLARVSSATVENPSPTADSLPEYDRFGHGHYFSKKTFHKPTYCHHCTDMLWGIIGQGFICEVCNFVVHERCLKTVVSPCSTVASNVIKVSDFIIK